MAKKSRKKSPFAPIEAAIAAIQRGEIIIVVDDEDRENEGDLTIAAEKVTPEAINFMARHGRGLICLPMLEERLTELDIPLMVSDNTARFSTAFTVSVEAKGLTSTGISAADRAATVLACIDPKTRPGDLARPGHTFPLMARKGGVLVRAGQTEAAVDLARIAGLYPAGVICEVMNEDGTMARLPDLQLFAAEHDIKIGTIAALIEHRSRTETLVEKVGCREIQTAWGPFTAHAFKDKPSNGVHLALVRGKWSVDDTVDVRVHEPLSVLDALELNRALHSWSLDASLAHLAAQGKGVAVLLNCGETGAELLSQFDGTARPAQAPERGRMDLRSYGIGAQILRECGVHRMNLLGTPRRMPSMAAGYGLEIAGYITKDER